MKVKHYNKKVDDSNDLKFHQYANVMVIFKLWLKQRKTCK